MILIMVFPIDSLSFLSNFKLKKTVGKTEKKTENCCANDLLIKNISIYKNY